MSVFPFWNKRIYKSKAAGLGCVTDWDHNTTVRVAAERWGKKQSIDSVMFGDDNADLWDRWRWKYCAYCVQQVIKLASSP